MMGQVVENGRLREWSVSRKDREREWANIDETVYATEEPNRLSKRWIPASE